MVRRFVQAVSEQAVGTGLIRGVRPDQQLVKVYLMIKWLGHAIEYPSFVEKHTYIAEALVCTLIISI